MQKKSWEEIEIEEACKRIEEAEERQNSRKKRLSETTKVANTYDDNNKNITEYPFHLYQASPASNLFAPSQDFSEALEYPIQSIGNQTQPSSCLTRLSNNSENVNQPKPLNRKQSIALSMQSATGTKNVSRTHVTNEYKRKGKLGTNQNLSSNLAQHSYQRIQIPKLPNINLPNKPPDPSLLFSSQTSAVRHNFESRSLPQPPKLVTTTQNPSLNFSRDLGPPIRTLQKDPPEAATATLYRNHSSSVSKYLTSPIPTEENSKASKKKEAMKPSPNIICQTPSLDFSIQANQPLQVQQNATEKSQSTMHTKTCNHEKGQNFSHPLKQSMTFLPNSKESSKSFFAPKNIIDLVEPQPVLNDTPKGSKSSTQSKIPKAAPHAEIQKQASLDQSMGQKFEQKANLQSKQYEHSSAAFTHLNTINFQQTYNINYSNQGTQHQQVIRDSTQQQHTRVPSTTATLYPQPVAIPYHPLQYSHVQFYPAPYFPQPAPPPMQTGYFPPHFYAPYPYHPYLGSHHHPHHYFPHQYQPPISVTDHDVLCGRGGAINSHPGNRYFRKLVKENEIEYVKAKKRDKPDIADKIVNEIRSKGGRFLFKERSSGFWIDIGENKAREKTCQALRESAPQLKAQFLNAESNDLSKEMIYQSSSNSSPVNYSTSSIKEHKEVDIKSSFKSEDEDEQRLSSGTPLLPKDSASETSSFRSQTLEEREIEEYEFSLSDVIDYYAF